MLEAVTASRSRFIARISLDRQLSSTECGGVVAFKCLVMMQPDGTKVRSISSPVAKSFLTRAV
jgi:(2Fe-2S) ferredoxin